MARELRNIFNMFDPYDYIKASADKNQPESYMEMQKPNQ